MRVFVLHNHPVAIQQFGYCNVHSSYEGISKGDVGEILFVDGIIYNVLFKDCYGGDKCVVPMLAFQFERTGKDFVVINVRL